MRTITLYVAEGHTHSMDQLIRIVRNDWPVARVTIRNGDSDAHFVPTHSLSCSECQEVADLFRGTNDTGEGA